MSSELSQYKKNFSRQLGLSFAILTVFAVIQSALTLWVARESDYHIEKGRLSNRMLTEFIDLGGNKQRLKVWLAQYLLTNDSSLEVKNNLIFKMNNSLLSLEQLFMRDEELGSENAQERLIIAEQKRRFQTLKINIEKLEQEVNRIDKKKHLDPGQAWKFMIQIFDSLDGNDLRKVINDAIEIQKLRATEAETTAKNYIKYFNTSVYFLTALIVIITVLFSVLVQRAVKDPIQNLVKAAIEYSKGNMSYRIQKIPNNEFGILALKFNEMALELEKAKRDEQQKRSEIEQAVATRTEELKFAIDKLQKTEFERKIFLSNISHELKTPATAILGEASVTLRGADKNITDYKDSLLNIQTIGRQLSHRIDDLLLLARTDGNFFRIQLTEFSTENIEPLLKEALDIVDASTQTQFNISTNIDKKTILIDRDRFVQLAVIILDNAVKYNSGSSPIDISLQSDRSQLTLTVKNAYENLNDTHFDKIFDRYYRSHHARINRPDGLGIGLHLAQTIVSSHYGHIKAEAVDQKYFKISIGIPIKGET